jgi:hypothetical protein
MRLRTRPRDKPEIARLADDFLLALSSHFERISGPSRLEAWVSRVDLLKAEQRDTDQDWADREYESDTGIG